MCKVWVYGSFKWVNVWLNKIKTCLGVFWGTKAEAVRDGVTDPSNSADRIGVNKKQRVAILYQLYYGLSQKCSWFECYHAVK